MEPRHKFGNLTLLLALASLMLAAFSLGSVWATAEDSHVTEVYDLISRRLMLLLRR